MILPRLPATVLALSLFLSQLTTGTAFALSRHRHAQVHPTVTAAHPAVSRPPASNTAFSSGTGFRVVGANGDAREVKELLAAFNDMVDASSQHRIDDILKHYNPQFISGDNLTLQQLKDMIQETWKEYPNITYRSDIQEIRINKDWATVETLDHSASDVPADKNVINVAGKMTSESRSLLFFRRVGDTWEVTSDATLWEDAVIRRGVSDNVKITLSAPEQVKAGDTYSAEVNANLPEGTFSLVTIDNEPLVYPKIPAQEKLRTLGGDSSQLQRVMRANTTNHNEIVVATLALTSIEQSNPERPALMVNGIISIVKRVNVVPLTPSELSTIPQTDEVMTTSASGKVNVQTIEKPTPTDLPGLPTIKTPSPVSSPSDDEQSPPRKKDKDDDNGE